MLHTFCASTRCVSICNENHFTNENLHAIIAERTSETGKSVCKVDNVLGDPQTDIKGEYYKKRIKMLILLHPEGLI